MTKELRISREKFVNVIISSTCGPTGVVGDALQLRGFTDDVLGRAVAGVELLDEGWRKVWVVVDKALE